jgi:hypothetical protein
MSPRLRLAKGIEPKTSERNNLANETIANETEAPEIPRKDVVGGSVNPEEKALIEAARERAGIKTMSEFVRETMLARARHILKPKRHEDVAA